MTFSFSEQPCLRISGLTAPTHARGMAYQEMGPGWPWRRKTEMEIPNDPPATREAAILAALPRHWEEACEPFELGPFLGNLPKELVVEVVKLLDGEDLAGFAEVNDTCWNVARPFEAWYFSRLQMVRFREGGPDSSLESIHQVVAVELAKSHGYKLKKVGGSGYFYDPAEIPTMADLAHLRFAIITRNRRDAMDEGVDFAIGSQNDPEEELMMFTTATGNEVIEGIPNEVKKALALVPASARFDALFGLTYALFIHDSWLTDNEAGCALAERVEDEDEDQEVDELREALYTLARAWRITLAFPNDRLGVDEEFTRPAIEAMLGDFKESVEVASRSSDRGEDLELWFDWDPERASDQAAVFAHFDALDELCARLDADEIYFVRGDYDIVSSTRQIPLTPGRKEAIEKAETFVMGGIQISATPDGMFEFHHRENSNKICRELGNAVEKALARPTPAAKFDALFALTRQLNLPNDEVGLDIDTGVYYPPDGPGPWMTENDLWRPGDAMQAGVARLGAGWKQLLGTYTDEQMKIDREFTRPGIEALLEEFEKKLKAFAHSRVRQVLPMGPTIYEFDWHV